MKRPDLIMLVRAVKTTIKFSLSLLLLVFCIGFILVGTDSGFRFLVNKIHNIGPAHIQFSKVKGNLLGQLEFIDFQYQDPGLKVSVNHFHLSWQATQLLNNKLSINLIKSSGIYIEQQEATEQQAASNTQANTPDAEFTLPDLNLPFSIFLKQLQLSDIHIISSVKTEATIINSIGLKADILNNQLKLHQLTLAMPEIQTNIRGSAKLSANYPLNLNSQLRLSIPEQTDLNFTGTIKGDLLKLQIEQHSSGLLEASINAQLFQALGPINWNAAIQVNQLPLALLLPDNNNYLNSQINLSGNLEQANIHLQTKALLPAKDEKTSSNTLDSSSLLVLDAKVGWQEKLQWQAILKTTKFNPAIFYPDWPGALDIHLQSNGQLSTNDQIKAMVNLNSLTGQLRQKPLSGEGQFDINNSDLKIKQFQLLSGEALLKIDGDIAPQNNLNWFVDIKQLSDILPLAQGSIKGKGTLKGSTEQAVIDASLKLNNILYHDMQLEKADLNCLFNTQADKHSAISFIAQNLEFDSQHLKKLKVTIDGPLETQIININVQHQQADLTIGAQGQFDIKQLSWQGEVQHTSINNNDLGQWTQQKPAELFLNEQKISLSSFCLHHSLSDLLTGEDSSLCTQINWQPKAGNVQLSLNNLAFQQFKSYLPDDILLLSGAVDMTANIELEPQLQAHIKAQSRAGKLTYQPMDQAAISLNHKNGLLEVNYDRQQLQTNWHIEMGPHLIQGKLSTPRTQIEADPLNAPIQGNMNINIKDLDLLSILAPQITDIDGHLLANLQLGGRLASPKISGQADFIAKYLSIRDFGIHIEDIAIHLHDKNAGQELVLQGSLLSGKGRLAIDGLLGLNKEQGFPLMLKLKGDNFLISNIPEAYVIISPDTQLSLKNGLMRIAGNIQIPEAIITASEIPEGSVPISPDIEVIGADKETPTNLDLDITLDFENNVKLNAFGLKTNIEGTLTVKQKPKQLMTGNGELYLTNGTYRAYGQDLKIDKGRIFYTGGNIKNPGIKLVTSRTIANTQVGINVSGSATKPKINAFSDDKDMETKDIISLILTGQKVNNLKNAKIYAGKEISEKLSVGVNTGVGNEGSEFITRYKLTDKIQLEGTSSTSKNSGNIIYTFELK